MPRGVFKRTTLWATPNNTISNRKCTKCNQIKSRTEFYQRKGGTYFRSTCKACDRKDALEWYLNNPDKAKQTNRKTTLLRSSGLTIEQYEMMLSSQGGVCAICGERGYKNNLSVDHDHTTGFIRGLLCDLCNQAIGMLRDDVYIAKKLIDYLNHHSTKDSKYLIKINPKWRGSRR